MCLKWKISLVPQSGHFWVPLKSKEIKPVNPKGNQPWTFIGRTEAEAPVLWPPDAELTHWKRPWWWERLKAEGEAATEDEMGWMASLTQWTWVWANSGRNWRTGKPGVLQSMGSQRAGPDLATEQQLVTSICHLTDQFYRNAWAGAGASGYKHKHGIWNVTNFKWVYPW